MFVGWTWYNAVQLSGVADATGRFEVLEISLNAWRDLIVLNQPSFLQHGFMHQSHSLSFAFQQICQLQMPTLGSLPGPTGYELSLQRRLYIVVCRCLTRLKNHLWTAWMRLFFSHPFRFTSFHLSRSRDATDATSRSAGRVSFWVAESLSHWTGKLEDPLLRVQITKLCNI